MKFSISIVPIIMLNKYTLGPIWYFSMKSLIVYRPTKHKLQQAEWSTKYIPVNCRRVCAELTKDIAHLVKLRTDLVSV